MKNDILKYIQNQLAQAPHRLRGHVTDFGNRLYHQRYLYKELEKQLEDFIAGRTEMRWMVIPGLRGVGKTTIVAQLFLSLIARFDLLRILYISMDEVTALLGSNLSEALEAYETILGQSFEKLDVPIFIFIDEVQYDPKWGVALKSLHDRSKKVFICCTGSSAVSLQTNPDIYRRVLLKKLYPLSFPEYQMLKNGILPTDISEKIKQAVYFSQNTAEAFESLKPLETEVLQYWSRLDKLEIQHYLSFGTLPFVLQFSNPVLFFETISGLLDKIIFKDIESLKSFDFPTLHAIKRLLFLLSDANDALSVGKLPNLVGIESSITIQRVLSVLEQTELLARLLPYGSQKSKVTKPSKYLFLSPAIRMALLGLVGKEATYQVRMGKLLEDAAALHFNREFISLGIGALFHDPAQGSADFILQIANRKEIVIEIGIGKKGITQVRNTMQKIKSNYGVVVGDSPLTHFQEEKILFIPLHYFLLMG